QAQGARLHHRPPPQHAGRFPAHERHGRLTGMIALAFVAADTPEAREALAQLVQRYGNVAFEAADAIVALGGDGFLLETLHRTIGSRIPVYGMNRGSIGFLLNQY